VESSQGLPPQFQNYELAERKRTLGRYRTWASLRASHLYRHGLTRRHGGSKMKKQCLR
jgi:hypothetical protein